MATTIPTTTCEIDTRAVREPQAVEPTPYAFPDPLRAPKYGLVGTGGDLAPGTILEAYCRGIFPWPHGDEDELWFSPNPRTVIPIGGLHVSRRLARRIRRREFVASVDRAFRDVMEACSVREEGTWITRGYQAAYLRLHETGWAHSFEAWTPDGRLAGGLYGIAVGSLFGAESMFHRVTDASKFAMAAMMQYLEERAFTLVDVQMMTPHLASMGAVEIPREEYLVRVAGAIEGPQRFALGRSL
jgi:leucyl/phenylalanyl-tRNA--protein transferase